MSRGETSFSLKYVPLLLHLRCLETARLPKHLGSMLHGIVGWSLLQDKKVYQYLFENRREKRGGTDIVNPYIIDPPRRHEVYQSGDVPSFQIILLGDAVHYADKVCKDLINTRIFSKGALRKTFELVEILHGRELYPIWNLKMDGQTKITSNILHGEVFKEYKNCSIHLLTPLRIRRKRELLTDIDFATIIRNITRRVTELTRRYGGFFDMEEIDVLCHEARSYCNELIGTICGRIRTLFQAGK